MPYGQYPFSRYECPPNTADQLRSSVACAGFVSCIRLFAGTVIPSQVLRLEAGILGNASEHLRTQLFVIVKGKRDVRPPRSRKRAVGTRLALDGPPYLEERCQYARGTRTRPGGHAALKEMSTSSGPASPCSS